MGGVARCAADPLLQADQFARQNGELRSQLLIFLPETWISCCWYMINVLTPAGVACQSESEISAAGVVIAGDLCLR